jgi:hypothetical protein
VSSRADAPFDTSPSNVGQGLTLAAALVATVALVPVPTAVGLGVLATGLFAAGLRRAATGLVDAAAGTLAVALIVAGVFGAPAELLVVSTAAAVLAWDVADNALTVGEQLGRRARTERLELVHAAATLTVAVVGSAFAYGVFQLAGGGRPLLAVVLLLLGATLIVAVLR